MVNQRRFKGVLMITMMITKDDDKGGDKKLKDQSKNNSSKSRTIQEFKIRIMKNSRLKNKV